MIFKKESTQPLLDEPANINQHIYVSKRIIDLGWGWGKAQGHSQDFSKGVTHRDTIRGSPTIYGLYRSSPLCISGLSRIFGA